MAVVTVSSTPVANADAKPVVKNSAKIAEGSLLNSVGSVALANGDSIGSVYRMVRIRSGCRVDSITMLNDAITSGAADIGLYNTQANGGAVVSQQFFAAAASIATASGGAPVGNLNLMKAAQATLRVWEILGLARDPGIEYDVALTLTAATTAAGSVALKASYTQSGPG